MITLEKLRIYKKYNADIDGWARAGKRDELKIMNDNDWSVIDKLIQEVELVDKGLASKKFKENLNEKMKEFCEDKETEEQLRRLAKKGV